MSLSTARILCVLPHFCLAGYMLRPHVTGAATSCLQLNGRLVEQCFPSSGHRYIPAPSLFASRPYLSFSPVGFLVSFRWAFQLRLIHKFPIYKVYLGFIFSRLFYFKVLVFQLWNCCLVFDRHRMFRAVREYVLGSVVSHAPTRARAASTLLFLIPYWMVNVPLSAHI